MLHGGCAWDDITNFALINIITENIGMEERRVYEKANVVDVR